MPTFTRQHQQGSLVYIIVDEAALAALGCVKTAEEIVEDYVMRSGSFSPTGNFSPLVAEPDPQMAQGKILTLVLSNKADLAGFGGPQPDHWMDCTTNLRRDPRAFFSVAYVLEVQAPAQGAPAIQENLLT